MVVEAVVEAPALTVRLLSRFDEFTSGATVDVERLALNRIKLRYGRSVDDWKHGMGGRCAIGGFSAAES